MSLKPALKKVDNTQPKLEKSSAIKRGIKGRRTDRLTACQQSYEFMATPLSGSVWLHCQSGCSESGSLATMSLAVWLH